MSRIAVVGIGGVGSMAAWRLAQAGHKVVGLEQFLVDHDRGSSYGDSRIVRRVYPDALYTSLMAESYALWDELIASAPAEELLVRAGGLFFGPADHPDVQAAGQALEQSGVPFETLDARECGKRYPAFRLQPHEVALLEPTMGFARASRCVRAATRLARALGAEIREECPVAGIESARAGVCVITDAGERIEADGLVVCVGPWAAPLLRSLGLDLPLTVTRQAYVHLQPASHPEAFTVRNFPTWIDAGTNHYGFPILGGLPGVKLASHDRGIATLPETVDRTVTEADKDLCRAYARERFPWLGPEVVYAKICLYTNTPDEHFVIDRIPGLSNSVVIGGLSGHGFKFTPLLGQIAADLVTGRPIPHDLSRFRAGRLRGAE